MKAAGTRLGETEPWGHTRHNQLAANMGWGRLRAKKARTPYSLSAQF